MAIDAKRVMSGNFGQVWLDNEEIFELTAFQAKDEYGKEEVNRVGTMSKGYKITSVDGKGSMTINKVYSRMVRKIGKQVREGKTPTFTLIGKLDDPDAFGAERVVFKGVVFDDLTIFDFEANSLGSNTCTFTYEDWEALELV